MEEKHSFCKEHNTHPNDEKWQVMLDEIVESSKVHFEGEVCPCCYYDLVYTLKKTKRALKVESRSAVRLRRENSEIRAVLEAVRSTVQSLTGTDAQELAEKDHSKSQDAIIDLKHILPNLITEAVNMARKKKDSEG